MAFSAKKIKPDLNCVRGRSVQDCMDMINMGDADLITLDAADVYSAGKLVASVFLSVSHCDELCKKWLIVLSHDCYQFIPSSVKIQRVKNKVKSKKKS